MKVRNIDKKDVLTLGWAMNHMLPEETNELINIAILPEIMKSWTLKRVEETFGVDFFLVKKNSSPTHTVSSPQGDKLIPQTRVNWQLSGTTAEEEEQLKVKSRSVYDEKGNAVQESSKEEK